MATPITTPLPPGLQTVDEALHRTRFRRFRVLPFLGPAFIACVAYLDPGNFATNIAGGSRYGYRLVWVIVAANLMAMATDLAEFRGAAIGIHLLTGMALFPAAVIAGIASFLILGLLRYGARPLEAVIATLVGVIGVCYIAELGLARPDFGQVIEHAVVPQFGSSDALLLSVGIIGA